MQEGGRKGGREEGREEGREVGFLTLGALESSCLHSWGLLCTCHFSLWGGTCLCMCERQEAIIKESCMHKAGTHTHTDTHAQTHTYDNSHTSLRRKQPLFRGFYFEDL